MRRDLGFGGVVQLDARDVQGEDAGNGTGDRAQAAAVTERTQSFSPLPPASSSSPHIEATYPICSTGGLDTTYVSSNQIFIQSRPRRREDKTICETVGARRIPTNWPLKLNFRRILITFILHLV